MFIAKTHQHRKHHYVSWLGISFKGHETTGWILPNVLTKSRVQPAPWKMTWQRSWIQWRSFHSCLDINNKILFLFLGTTKYIKIIIPIWCDIVNGLTVATIDHRQDVTHISAPHCQNMMCVRGILYKETKGLFQIYRGYPAKRVISAMRKHGV